MGRLLVCIAPGSQFSRGSCLHFTAFMERHIYFFTRTANEVNVVISSSFFGRKLMLV